jgi:DNA (cytosine-5)-methyltransferase 1
MPIYKFNKDLISQVYVEQLKAFHHEMNSFSSDNGFYEIPFARRGFKVNNEKKKYSNDIQAISFFSGAGGLDIGAQLAGVKVISSCDFDFDSYKTISSNSFFGHCEHLHTSIQDLNASSYNHILKKNKTNKLILIGGPPCQPFSKAGYWVTHKNRLGSDDPRNMIGNYLRLIGELKPDGFLLENVESILHPKNKNAMDSIEHSISDLGYDFIVYKANAIDFGVPQKRKRIFIIASKNKIKSLPIKTHGTINECKLDNSLKPHEPVINWIGGFQHSNYFEPEESINGKTYESEVLQIPPGKNYFSLTERDGHPSPKFEANKRFWSFLLKLHPLMPSWTIAAQPGPWVGPLHWENRRLRACEAAAIQTFPSDYFFYGSRRSIQKQIGNAVPPLLGQSMVQCLVNNL